MGEMGSDIWGKGGSGKTSWRELESEKVAIGAQHALERASERLRERLLDVTRGGSAQRGRRGGVPEQGLAERNEQCEHVRAAARPV